jgi:hypothetical protein
LLLVPVNNDPFTINVAEALLTQVSSYRAATAEARSAAIAHLITGKQLAAGTIGVAVRSGVCSVQDGVSLSQGTSGSFFSGLLMAHEIAHNLGAVHDGATGTSCAAVGAGYIMWPFLTGSSTFSQCSLDSMRPVIASATCLTPASVADVAASLTRSVISAELEVPFTIAATVSSIGTNSAQGAGITFSIPASLAVSAITASSGTCSAGATPSCSLGDIPAGEQRTVQITSIASSVTPQVIVTANVVATNDRVVNNNSVFTDFAVINNADAMVTVSPGSASVRTGDPVDYTIRIQSVRTQPVRNARLSFTPSGLDQVTYTPSSGTCTGFGDCTFGDIAPGTLITIAIHGIAFTAGTHSHFIRFESSNDTDGNNSSPTFTLVISPTIYDVALVVAAPSASADVGSRITLPRITLRSEQYTGGMVVRVPIPSFTTIQSVSSGWACTGTTTLECNVSALLAGTETSVDITLNANQAGTFTSRIEVSAANDSNPANNSADIAITANAVAAPSPPGNPPPPNGGSGGAGGGGGGRIEWVLIGLLALLAARRATLVPNKSRRAA